MGEHALAAVGEKHFSIGQRQHRPAIEKGAGDGLGPRFDRLHVGSQGLVVIGEHGPGVLL